MMPTIGEIYFCRKIGEAERGGKFIEKEHFLDIYFLTSEVSQQIYFVQQFQGANSMYRRNMSNDTIDYRKYLIILSLLYSCPAPSTAQFDMPQSRSGNDPCPSVVEMRSADNTPLAEYVTVRQIFAPIAIRYFFGEVNVRNRKGDTMSIQFDHPLSGKGLTNER